jgi:hypothetical protein
MTNATNEHDGDPSILKFTNVKRACPYCSSKLVGPVQDDREQNDPPVVQLNSSEGLPDDPLREWGCLDCGNTFAVASMLHAGEE